MSRRIALPRQSRRILIPRVRRSDFWHLHAHSRYSFKDALPAVEDMVATAHAHGQPAMALTDHGNMAGAIDLYKACRKFGMAPFPGSEIYLRKDKHDTKSKRYHAGLVAFTTEGYEALVRISTLSFTRANDNFHNKPHLDFADFAEFKQRGWTEGIALTTGCYFGMVQQTLVNQGNDAARWLIQTLNQWFPHTYVELQHHHIDHGDGHEDDWIVDQLDYIARDLGLPTVITQDSHYCHAEDKPHHETLKRLVSWSEDPSEAVFPGDSFHLADEAFVKSHYLQPIWERGLDGLRDLLAKHTLTIPQLEHYSYNVPIVTAGDPMEELAVECSELLAEWTETRPWLDIDRYYDRLMEELEVVRATNMAGYLMLNKMICDHMRDESIFFQARGSASGSLICYLLDITQEDPIAEGLRYERFLSKDRTKPPDIDLDVDDSRRQDVIEWLATRFNVCQIGTWAEYSIHTDGPKAGRGSLLVDYLSHLRKEGKDKVANSIDTLRDLPRNDARALSALSQYKSFKSYGTHAGGLVITSTKEEFDRLVPTMLVASSDTVVTQYDMDCVEDLGLLKEDILGQKSLRTLATVCDLIGKDLNTIREWIPTDDKDVYRMIRRQDVDGVFQLEGWTNRKGCQELRPKRLRDLIHLVAIYRPATIDSGIKDAYIERRAGWSGVPDRHPILNAAFKETYGLPVFQDQVIDVLREIGFDPENLTKFLKAVKASNENIGDAAKVIAGYQEMFYDLASQAGFASKDADFTWDAIEGFSKYGFNKAHATAYGRRSYWMAWLRYHHPLEFHTALLRTWAGTVKERDYILATKQADIKMLRPDVNISDFTWSIDRKVGAIRRGLLSVKGVGDVAATEIATKAPFADIEDLIARCEARAVNGGKNWSKDSTLNGVLGKLQDAGALKSLGL